MLAIVEPDHGRAVFELQAHNLGGIRELRAEFPRLQDGTACEIGAGNAGREAEIILDLESITTVASPSDDPYTAAASPAGPPPTTTKS